MLAASRCFRVCEIFRSSGEMKAHRVCRNATFSRAFDPGWSTSRGFSQERCLRVGTQELDNPNYVFSGNLSYRRNPMDASRKGGFYKRLRGFLWDPPSPKGNGPYKESSSLYKGHALFSTSAGELTGAKQAGKPTHSNNSIKGPSEEQVADMRILHTLARYLWLKDKPEFRFRVILALGLLIGSKVLNVQVPFLFKLAVDWLSTASGTGGVLASLTTANSTLLALFVSPAAVLAGYGIARAGASACNEIRNAVFSKVALRTIRTVSRKVFSHLHELDLRYHLRIPLGWT